MAALHFLKKLKARSGDLQLFQEMETGAMHENFRTYQLSLELYRSLKGVKLPYSLRDQLIRAASSVCLNLSEGSAKPTQKDRLRFYFIAFGSLREVQTLIAMEPEALGQAHPLADKLAAHLYKLTRS